AFGETRGSCLSATIDCNARAACVREKSPESSTLAADTEVGLWRARDIRGKRLWLRRNTRRDQSKVGPRAIEGRVRLARRAKFLPGRRGPSIMTQSLSEWTKYMSALTTDYLDLIER